MAGPDVISLHFCMCGYRVLFFVFFFVLSRCLLLMCRFPKRKGTNSGTFLTPNRAERGRRVSEYSFEIETDSLTADLRIIQFNGNLSVLSF